MGTLKRLKSVLGKATAVLRIYGFDVRTTLNALRGTPSFLRDKRAFKQMMKGRTDWTFGHDFPVLADRYAQSGQTRGHYFHQDMLVARRIYERKPRRQIDVGSRIDGFIAHVATFREIEVIDIRPLDDPIHNVRFLQMDLMNELGVKQQAICDSLSCLHTLEHFGLGRYGDNLDPDGYKTGFANLLRILEPGGILYFSVPAGRQRIEFNAHRVFGLPHLLEMFAESHLILHGFSYIDDDGNLAEDVAISQDIIAAVNSMRDGCGIFELIKPR